MTTTNMSLNEPSVGVTTGPTWATQTNSNWETIDTHDHTSGKGVQLTPSALNINADLEFNQNSATELKNVIFDSSVTAATTNYSVYQSGGNLYWRNGSGTAVQITDGSGINTSGGSISNMTGNSQVQFSGVNKSYTFKFDSTLSDGIAKLVMSDIQLYFYNGGSATTRSVNLKYTGSGTGANTLTVPDETGTLLSTATSFAGVINIATSSSNAAINLKPNGTGHVVVGNGSATGKLTSNGAYDLVLDTNSGTNSGNITITDAANGNITFAPNGTGEIVIGSGSASGKITSNGAYDLVLDTNTGTNSGSITITDGADGNITFAPNGTGEIVIGSGSASGKITSNGAYDLVLDTNSGSDSGNFTITDGANGAITVSPNGSGVFTIDGSWTAASQTCADLGTVTTADINGGTWQGTIDGSWTAAGQTCADLGSVTTCDINGGTITGITDLAVADGGTGASNASDARTNLGVAIGSDVQAYDADLAAIAGLANTDGNFIVGNGSAWVAESGSTARTSIGLGNVTNESKATMFSSPTFTGTVTANTIQPASGNTLVLNEDGGSAVMTISTGGDIGINVTPASSIKLYAYGNAKSRIAKFWNDGNGEGYGGINVQAGTDNQSGTTVFFEADDGDGQGVGTLSNVSGTFQLTDSSDIRLKTAVVDTTVKGLETINLMKIRDFKWKKSGKVCQGGFIANELMEVFPEAVIGEPNAVKKNSKNETVIDPMQISRERLVPILVKAVQELSAKVTALEGA